jgi:very-short-patch-repair endonuclease
VLREARIGRSIADALLPSLAVAIEVDGGVHDAFRADHDAQRRRYLEERDITVLMFSNADMLAGPEVLTGRLRPYLRSNRRVCRGASNQCRSMANQSVMSQLSCLPSSRAMA